MPIIRVGGTVRLEQGILPDKEWEAIKREEALKVHREIMAASGNTADEDPQVGWNFRKDWRTSPLPSNVVWGSSYDYWNLIVDEVMRLWRAHSGGIDDDFIADKIAKAPDGWAKAAYMSSLQVWQNGLPVSPGTKLHGLRIDIGPTMDYAAFLEQWSHSRSTQAVHVIPYQRIGLLNFIARQIRATFPRVHAVMAIPIKPDDTSAVDKTPNRTKPVTIFPVIRIVSRHYRKW